MLNELIAQGAEGVVFALINDAESAAACHAAGPGTTLGLALGGKSDGTPLQVQATVERLSDGRFTGTGPMAGGNPIDLGPTALVRVAPGIRVIVVTRKMQALDQAIFTSCPLRSWVNPRTQRMSRPRLPKAGGPRSKSAGLRNWDTSPASVLMDQRALSR